MKKKNIKNKLYGTLLSVATFTVPFSNGVRAIQIKESTDGIGKEKIESGSIILGITKFNPEVTLDNKGIETANKNESAFKETTTNSNIYYYFNGTWYNITSLNKPEIVKDKMELEVLNNAEVYYVDNVEKVLSIPYEMTLKDGYSLEFKSNDPKKDAQVLFVNNTLNVPATIKKLDIYLENDKTGSKTLIDTFIKQRGNDNEVVFAEIKQSEGTIAWDNTTGKTKTLVANVIKNAIYFDGQIAWYERMSGSEFGNYVGAIITSPNDIKDFSKTTVNIDGEETTWITIAGNNNYFNYKALVTDTIRSHKIIVKWSEGNTQEFTIDALDTATLAPAETRTLTFETNGGTLANPTIALPYGTKYNELPVPTKSNYEFAGWYAEKEFTTRVSSVELIANTTLYAKWVEMNYTVSFDVDGLSPITTAYGSVINLPTATKENYKFAGWYTDKELTNKVQNNTLTVNGNITLYPSWIKILTVTFKDGEKVIDTIKVDENTTFENPYTTLESDNMIFAGWSLNGVAYDFTKPVTENIELVAMWSPKPTYTIIFNSNDGTDTTLTQTVAVGTTVKLNANSFTRSGYAFLGWSTTSGETGEEDINFTNEKEITDLAASGESITLYAVWLKGSYTISYNLDEGVMPEGIVLPTNYTIDTDIEITAKPELTGYKFTGWTDEAGNKTETIVIKNISGAKTFTANYEKIVYNVTFKDGTNEAVVPVDYNELVTEQTASKDGYTFDGWFVTNEDGTVTDTKFDFNTNILSNYTLNAVYTANEYTVTFDANEGTGSMEVQTFTYDKSAPLSKNTFTREDYNFIGWATTNDGKVSYTDEQVVSNLAKSGNVTLYAVWESKEKMVVFFYADNGSDAVLKTIAKGSKVSRPTDPEKDGHKFLGWFDKTGNEYDFNTPVNANIELTAKWEKNIYTINFNCMGGEDVAALSVKYGDAVTSLPTIEKEGFKFNGWYDKNDTEKTIITSIDEVKGNMFLVASWTEEFTVTFINGETKEGQFTVLDGESVSNPNYTLFKEGHTFAGWYKDLTDTEAYDFDAEVTGSFTLYAKWTIEEYTITYNSNVENVSFEGLTTSFNIDSANITIPKLTKDGYRFIGWSGTNLTGNENETITIETGSTLSRIYTANFVKVWTISYDVNGGSVSETIESKTVDEGTTFTAPTIVPTMTGHTFAGWYVNLDDENAYNFGTPATADVELKAKYTVNKYSIIFHSNTEGNKTETQENVEYGVSTSLRENTFTKDEFKFVGWATNPTGEAVYGDKATINGDTQLSEKENVDLYAVWTPITRYVVSFNSNGGTTITPKVVKENTAIAAPTAPTRDNYEFAGWLLNNEEYNFSSLVTDDIELVASWTANEYTISFNTPADVTIDSYTGAYGTEYVLPTPEKEGSTFLGWYTDNTYTTKVASTITITTDTELFARFDTTPFEVDGELTTLEDTLELLASNNEKAKIVNVKLLEDVTLNESLAINGKHIVNLDLNGKTIKSTNSAVITVSLNSSLYVSDSLRTGKVLASNGQLALLNNGTTVLNAGYYGKVNSAAWSGYVILNHGKMTVKSGVTVKNSGDFYYENNKDPYPSLFSNGYYNYFSNNASNGYVEGVNQANPTLIIDGGEFIGGKNTIKNDDGATLTINGGHFTNNIQVAVMNWNIATINGGVFEVPTGVDKTTLANGYYSNSVDNGNLTINGGTFKGEYVVKGLNGNKPMPNPVIITGGTFENSVAIINTANHNEMIVNISGGTFNKIEENDKITIIGNKTPIQNDVIVIRKV